MSRGEAPPGKGPVRGRRVLRAVDWTVAAGLFLGMLAMGEAVARSGDAADSGMNLSTSLLLGLGATMPLALVRVQLVVASGAAVTAVFLTFVVFDEATVAGLVGLLVVLYLLGRRGSRWVAPMLAPFVVYSAVALVQETTDNRWQHALLAAATVVAAGLGGGRWAWASAVARRASSQTIADALVENVARGERVRIARELHDVVAHHVSMIVVQAEAARLATPGMPAAGAERLVAIGNTARTALTEMRRLLGVLRDDAGSGPGSVASRQPQPGLQQLVELVDEARDASTASVRLILQGHVVPLDPGVELTVYRIVQEALTNARRHAPGAAVDVELAYADDTLRVLVRDNGPGLVGGRAVNRPAGRGHGLLGMHERVATVGGDLRIVPATPTGGVLVEALLPAARSPLTAEAAQLAATAQMEQTERAERADPTAKTARPPDTSQATARAAGTGIE